MSYIGNNRSGHWGEPLFEAEPSINGNGKAKVKVVFDEPEMEDSRHPLFKVNSGLPQSLGDALGDLDPERTSRILLSVIYGLRGVKKAVATVKSFWKNSPWQSKRDKSYYVPCVPTNPFDMNPWEDNPFISNARWQELAGRSTSDLLEGLGGVKNDLKIDEDPFRPFEDSTPTTKDEENFTTVCLIRMIKNAIPKIHESEYLNPEDITHSWGDVHFLNMLSQIGLDSATVTQIRRLPRESFRNFRMTIDPNWQLTDAPPSSPITNRPFHPGYEPLGDIYNGQGLGSFGAESGFNEELG